MVFSKELGNQSMEVKADSLFKVKCSKDFGMLSQTMALELPKNKVWKKEIAMDNICLINGGKTTLVEVSGKKSIVLKYDGKTLNETSLSVAVEMSTEQLFSHLHIT